MKRIISILLWSAISAAFIGPGTVTTASAAGAGYGFSLLWALVFSTVACLSLQEASARLTIASGKPLAAAMGGGMGQGGIGRWVAIVVVGSVVLGCAAYQMGNIMGAVAGASLKITLEEPRWITLICGLLAAGVLFVGSIQVLARILGCVVAVMGIAFLVCAFLLEPDLGKVARGCAVPTLPEGSGMLALGLVGTTVVPYNLFLGSGLAKGQSLKDARFGMAVAIPLGGAISMAILVVGTAVEGPLTFEALSRALEGRLGEWAGVLFAIGLFTAGFSSALTAPLAAALSFRGLSGKEKEARWHDRGWRFRSIWAAVLATGLGFGLAGVKPIPAILMAQALNGAILPVVAIFLLLAVNNPRIMGAAALSSAFANVIMGFSVFVAVLLGTTGILKASCSVLGLDAPGEGIRLAVAGAAALLIAVPVVKQLVKQRRTV